MKISVLNIKKSKAALFLAVILLPLGITFFAWTVTSEYIHVAQTIKFDTLAGESEKALFNRMNAYHYALLGGKGLYEGSDTVSRKEWRAYVKATDVLKNFPGINGIGTIYDVKPGEIDAFVQQAANDGFPDFKIKPEGTFPENFIINFIEPIEINRPAVGLNTGFEANRREAAIKSRDSGKAAITKRILLVQDAEQTPGFLLFLPTYRNDVPLNSVEQRRSAFKHWIYAPFIGKNFMRNLTDSQGTTLNLQVFDGTEIDPESLIYDSRSDHDTHKPRFVVAKQIQIMQQNWYLVWSSTQQFEVAEQRNEPVLILLLGLLFTGLFGTFVIVTGIGSQHSQSVLTKNQIVPLMAFGITSAVVLLLHSEVSSKESALVENATKEASSSLSFALTRNINERIRALDRMADRWTTRGRTPYAEWKADAENYLRHEEGLKTVEWVDNTFHVRWAEPVLGNESAVGMDIRSYEPRGTALTRVYESSATTLTRPLDIAQGYSAVISHSPVSRNGQFDGFMVGIFGIDELINAVLKEANASQFVVQLSYDGRRFYSSTQASPPARKEWRSVQTLNIVDKQWTLEIFPTASFIQANTSYLPELILIIGLVLAAMVALIINSAQRSRQKTLLVQEKEHLLSTFVQHTPAAVAMFDTHLNYIAASDRWRKDYDLSEVDIAGLNHKELVPYTSDDGASWQENFARALCGEVVKVAEQPVIRDSGRREWLRYELRPWTRGEGQSGGIVMFSENITERKQMEIMKDEFVSTVNHELRTPLTSIQGSLGLLSVKARESLDEKGKRLLQLSYDNCAHLTHLVNDILDIEKIAAGKMEYKLETVELNALVKDIVERHMGYADKYDVSFKIGLEDQEVFCRLDRSRFNQALVNLLSNAAKFSPAGGVVRFGVRRQDDGNVRVQVADDGPGISNAFRHKIFERFAQEDSSSTRTKSGTGLGLSITKSIIEAFGGTVGFDSIPGKGATFYFILPVEHDALENA